jgi:hypothetical protein
MYLYDQKPMTPYLMYWDRRIPSLNSWGHISHSLAVLSESRYSHSTPSQQSEAEWIGTAREEQSWEVKEFYV